MLLITCVRVFEDWWIIDRRSSYVRTMRVRYLPHVIRTLCKIIYDILYSIITGLPTYSVGGQISNGRWRLSLYVVCRRCRL